MNFYGLGQIEKNGGCHHDCGNRCDVINATPCGATTYFANIAV